MRITYVAGGDLHEDHLTGGDLHEDHLTGGRST